MRALPDQISVLVAVRHTHQRQRLTDQRTQQSAGMWQKQGLVADSTVADEALEARDPAFAFGARTGCLVGDFG